MDKRDPNQKTERIIADTVLDKHYRIRIPDVDHYDIVTIQKGLKKNSQGTRERVRNLYDCANFNNATLEYWNRNEWVKYE